MHSLVHKQVQKAEARHKLSQELLTYHMTVRDEDVDQLRDTMLNVGESTMPDIPTFSTFEYNPRDTERSITAMLSLRMFHDLNFMSTFKMREEKVARFMLIVQKGYRDTIPYHNWTHAFSVAHFSYTLMMNLKLVERNILRWLIHIYRDSFFGKVFNHVLYYTVI